MMLCIANSEHTPVLQTCSTVQPGPAASIWLKSQLGTIIQEKEGAVYISESCTGQMPLLKGYFRILAARPKSQSILLSRLFALSYSILHTIMPRTLYLYCTDCTIVVRLMELRLDL